MTVSRRIVFLFFAALIVSLLVFAVAFDSLVSAGAALGALANKADGAGIGKEIQSIQQALSQARATLAMVLLIGVGLFGAATFLFRRAIIQPLRNLESAIADAADRLDFTRPLPAAADDEVGRALQAYDRLQSRLRSNFSEIRQSLEHLLEVTEEVDHSSRKIARNSQVQSDASSNMAAAVEEMTVSISTVANQAIDARAHTQQSREIADQSAGVILNTVGDIQQISETVSEAAARIKTLRGDCDSISSVAKMIREIADQTNLLALNAAIEAARAGEQGRGFAVVADEVRKLAERTTNSTQEISDLLNRVQEGARLVVESMVNAEKAVGDGVSNAREAGESIDKLKTGAEAAAIVVADISGAMKEQETASTSIARNIEQIAQMSEQNSAAASASATGVGRMVEVGRAMAKTLSAYKVDTGEKKIVLRLADTHPEGHPAIRAAEAMAEMLDKRSQGRVTLKVIPGGVFGPEKDELEQLRDGTLDMTRASCAAFNKDCPATVIPALPFVFNSTEHQQRALDGAPGQEILASFGSSSYVGLAFFDCGSRNIYANKPIRSLADLRDLKLRVMQSDLWMAIARAMGAVPTPMAMEDIVSGFKTGLVEASEGNMPTFYDYRHHGAAKYYCLTEHAMVPELLVFSRKRWESLSAEDQSLVAAAARDCVPFMRRFWREREESARKGALEAGTVFVKDVDRESFQRVMRPVYDKFVTTPQLKSLFDAIKSMK